MLKRNSKYKIFYVFE